MGYTHYYTKKELDHSQEKWDAFIKDVKKVAALFNLRTTQSIEFIKDSELVENRFPHIKIGDGMGEGNEPIFSKDEVWFNGVGEESQDTMNIERVSSSKLADDYYKKQWEMDSALFGFTKTARKPYDLLVTATLVLYRYHFGDKVEVSGDGGSEGFEEGLNLVNETLKLNIQMEDIYPMEDF